MANFKMIIQYDGTRYRGWQRQKTTDLTIQGKIEAILLRQFGRTIEVDGSGRTDAGVHALGQVASFRIPEACMQGQTSREFCDMLMEMFCMYLPEDIAVIQVRPASDRFHARLNAVEKTYRYRIWNASYPNVLERRQMTHIPESLDAGAMRAAAAYLIGTHDYAAFCGNARMKKSTVRTVKEIRIEQNGPEIDLIYTGNGFLQNMVRILTGTLTEVGLHHMEAEQVKTILEGKTRALAGPTMPAAGLTLMEVRY